MKEFEHQLSNECMPGSSPAENAANFFAQGDFESGARHRGPSVRLRLLARASGRTGDLLRKAFPAYATSKHQDLASGMPAVLRNM
jgi:hypothetical protein